MNVIRLTSGQYHDIAGAGFTGRLTIGLTGDLDFEVETPGMESHRRANRVAIRNPEHDTEITVLPGYGHTQFPTGTKLFVALDYDSAGGTAHHVELPTFEVGGLRSFPVAAVLPRAGTVRFIAAEANSDSILDAGSAGVRSALRSSIDRDSLPEGRRRDVTVLLDVSASMQASTSPEAFDAICAFAAGVLATASGDRVLRLATSSSAIPMQRLDGVEDVRQLSSREFPRREVGWSMDFARLDPADALVVVSDDMPAEVMRHGGAVHLLTAREPVAPSRLSHTIFDQHLIAAVRDQDAAALAVPSRIMFDTLTRGEN
ncbi:hypothetical protein [Corynebacterium halotolerans]|uniref:hypothetical protein n=1 Tax=Corynebacterium halotolerans TaxID=225326 RepID=UPI003CFADE1C